MVDKTSNRTKCKGLLAWRIILAHRSVVFYLFSKDNRSNYHIVNQGASLTVSKRTVQLSASYDHISIVNCKLTRVLLLHARHRAVRLSQISTQLNQDTSHTISKRTNIKRSDLYGRKLTRIPLVSVRHQAASLSWARDYSKSILKVLEKSSIERWISISTISHRWEAENMAPGSQTHEFCVPGCNFIRLWLITHDLICFL